MYKDDLKLVEEGTREHAEYCSKIWSVDFEFDHYDPEVKCFYLRDHRISGREKLEYRYLFDLEKRIQTEYSKRYRVGIIYEKIPPE